MTSGELEHALDRMVGNISRGRFERSLSGLTAVSAAVTGAEVFLERGMRRMKAYHYALLRSEGLLP